MVIASLLTEPSSLLRARNHQIGIAKAGIRGGDGRIAFHRSQKISRCVCNRFAGAAIPEIPPFQVILGSKLVAQNTKPNGSDDPEGRAKNRRVEIVVTKTTKSLK
jgi:hypothetical protein